MRPSLDIRALLALIAVIAGCGGSDPGGSVATPAGSRARQAADGGATLATDDAAATSPGTPAPSDAGITTATDGGPPASIADGAIPNTDGAAPRGAAGMTAGVNVHAYPKPSAYGFTASDGKDRMGSALVALGSPAVRGATIGDTTFLTRLASFGVKEVVLLLSASAEGKPFDPKAVGPLLQQSLDAAGPLGLTVQVEGLNEWDLFNGKSYNAGVIPSGMSASDFVLYTQKALYEAAHPLGIQVLGPSVGHPDDATSLAFFPDVKAYVDVVNMHLYFTSNPESIPVATHVADHQVFEGTGKPLWVTETGISSYGGVTVDAQADLITRGLGVFSASKLIARAYIYELLDDEQPGLSGTTNTPDSGELHFGLFAFDGSAKPAAASFQKFNGSP